MIKRDVAIKKIADFIYEKPDVVVAILQESGYDISVNTATLPLINKLTLTALTNEEQPFTQRFDKVFGGQEYLNIVATAIMAGVSIASSFISANAAKKEAEKQRQLQRDITSAQLAQEEKFKYEELKLQGETARTQILANTLLAYNVALQEESTKRLKDTWIYVVGVGLAISFMYGTFLTLKE